VLLGLKVTPFVLKYVLFKFKVKYNAMKVVYIIIILEDTIEKNNYFYI